MTPWHVRYTTKVCQVCIIFTRHHCTKMSLKEWCYAAPPMAKFYFRSRNAMSIGKLKNMMFKVSHIRGWKTPPPPPPLIKKKKKKKPQKKPQTKGIEFRICRDRQLCWMRWKPTQNHYHYFLHANLWTADGAKPIYSRLLFTSEVRVAPICACKNNRWMWLCNASTSLSRDVTD